MKEFITKFKIPTLLGLGIIFFGLTGGVFLVLREQTFLSQAAPNLMPNNIAVTNIADNSVVISWQTTSAAPSFITYGQNTPAGQIALDDRDENVPTPRLLHYVTLKNLLPKTSYQFKINSGKTTSGVQEFETATPLTGQTGFTPIIGSVLDGETPLEEGVAFLFLPDASVQSSVIKEGNFLIPLSQIRRADLTDTYQLTEGMFAKLTIKSANGEASAEFTIQADSPPLPPVKLGENIDLTTKDTPSTGTIQNEYDLNGDGIVNTTDYTTLLQNLGKNPQNAKADINTDGIVDQKDRDLMAQRLKE
jgi:hypothetical protein